MRGDIQQSTADKGTQQTDFAHVCRQYKPMAPINSRHEHATDLNRPSLLACTIHAGGERGGTQERSEE
jgi:hypothetical protein